MRDPYSIIQTILVTEQALDFKENDNKYFFKVHPSANKIEIGKAIEQIYDVKVKSVNVMNCKGKKKRVGRSMRQGRTPNWKKAIVTISEGEISII
jgi:large subunit ribosomal protein L23